jgi:hypothetical protein
MRMEGGRTCVDEGGKTRAVYIYNRDNEETDHRDNDTTRHDPAGKEEKKKENQTTQSA